jgi:hypothetical protein
MIFILFLRACLYMCNLCFPLRCLFQCLFVCSFVLLFYFVCIPFLYLFIVYVMWLYFIIFSLKVYVALKWDYHILFVYWLIVYVVFLKNIVISCCCLFVFIFKIANFEKYSKIVCIVRRYFVVDKTVFTWIDRLRLV